jgi:hypothetical protein
MLEKSSGKFSFENEDKGFSNEQPQFRGERIAPGNWQ